MTAKLSLEERRSLFEWLATEPMGLAPGIYSTPGVGGGDACVGGTRIAVWVLESYRRDGMSDRDLLAAYPMLTLQELACAWAYAGAHPEEMNRLIRAGVGPHYLHISYVSAPVSALASGTRKRGQPFRMTPITFK